MIEIDGSYGEGGGQIIRTALSLSAITGKAFIINNIRSGRPNPGLQAQHLSCIETVKKLCNAQAEDVKIGSDNFAFIPGKLKPENFEIDIGTAGSIPLLLQSSILPMLLGGKKITATFIGGTDVKWSMSCDYFKQVILKQFGFLGDVEFKILQRGYYPVGNGKLELTIKPKIRLGKDRDFSKIRQSASALRKIDLTTQGTLLKINGISHASFELEKSKVAERVATASVNALKKLGVHCDVISQYSNSKCPGVGITLWATFGNNEGEINFSNPVVIGSDLLGEKGKSSEAIGEEAAWALIEQIDSNACVDKYLADNLIPLLGIVGGKIKVSEITEHCKTNIEITQKFLDCKFSIDGNEIKSDIDSN